MKAKKLIIVIILIFMLIVPSGCFQWFSYEFKHPELHAVSMSSLLGVYFYEENSVRILEEDDFGRVLFAYRGMSFLTKNGHMQFALVVSQRTTTKYSYFYPDVNFITCEVLTSKLYSLDGIPEEATNTYFTQEEIEFLKQRNDWNKPLNEEKLFQVKISNVKSWAIDFDKTKSELQRAFPELKRYSLEPFIIDTDDNMIYCARQMWYDENLQQYERDKAYLVIFDKDGNIYEDGIEEIIDIWDYEEQLIAFKARFNWDG